MKENRNLTLPIIGRVQHGEKITNNGKTRVIEYGHFIAKIQEANMQPYLDKFNELIKGSKTIDIQFLDDEPLSIKRVRYNQGGAACYCKDNEITGKQKVKNLWEPVECNSSCSYLQKDKNGKSQCNRIAWLRFFVPSISNDRLWLMKITGQQSIDNLDSYLQIQKLLGNSLRNVIFTIFLQQKEQVNSLGQTFNNYVLDILKKEDFILTNQIPQTTEKPVEISTAKAQNVNNNVVNQEQTENKPENVTTPLKTEDKKPKEKITKKEITPKKETKTKSKKADENKTETPAEENEFANYYVLDSTFTENITNKKGESKEYVIGKFFDINDKPCNIVIKPEDATELQKCEFGTVVELMVQDVAARKFAVGLKFISKLTKKVAA